jgi:hypothetical protein
MAFDFNIIPVAGGLGKPGAPIFGGGRCPGTNGGLTFGGAPGAICGGRTCCAFGPGLQFCCIEAARGGCGCGEFEEGRCCDCCAFGGGGCAYIFRMTFENLQVRENCLRAISFIYIYCI